MKKYTIILFYLFILIDNFSLNIIKGIRERTYSVYIEYPYLIYEILKLIILGILLGLYFYNGSIKKIYYYF